MEELYSDEIIRKMIERQDREKRMYHYTSLDTFSKIISGTKEDCFIFRAGSVYTMNDYKEMQIGYNYIRKYLPEIEQKLKVKKEEKLLNLSPNKRENQQIRKNFGKWLTNDDTSNFVISFSKKPDILPMWAIYGDNGNGVCLEFSPYIIKEYYKENLNYQNLQIENCVYQESDIKDFLLGKLEVVYKRFLEHERTEGRKTPLTKAKYLATMCGMAGAFIKHSGFEYEQEVRMNLLQNKEYWKFGETRHNHHIVYTETLIPIKALTDVIVGPAAIFNDVKNFIILTLRSKGIRIEPKPSKIPYRIF